MYRAGVYEAYKAGQVPPETEALWLAELIEGYAGALSIRDWEAVSGLEAVAREHKDARAVHHTVKFAARHLMSADSAVKLIYAERLVAMLKALGGSLSTEALHEAIRTAKVVLDDVVAKPLILDPGHDLESLGIKDKRAMNQRAGTAVEALKALLDGRD
ncbi:hypothetical protein [Cohnella sp. JJ-181]|uniref:hypothetical protein n=1 Tax=Cohnella rhizoplanae TaxID=2974897 RepID=UPI0022FF57EE|nr:hypothetical protein [Cohnella sp. JJ-181]CAI6079225.1 hypothetical protein COHCIP112018_02736 [Cohnella sp. JJ-181]